MCFLLVQYLKKFKNTRIIYPRSCKCSSCSRRHKTMFLVFFNISPPNLEFLLLKGLAISRNLGCLLSGFAQIKN